MGYAERFVRSKCDIAKQLEIGALNGNGLGSSYGDAVLLVTGAISAVSNQMWSTPLSGFDRKKFTQALADCPSLQGILKISLPLLIQDLRASASPTEQSQAQCLSNALLSGVMDAHIINDSFDQSETAILQSLSAKGLPPIPLKKIRYSSYINLLYQEIRCGYYHSYGPGAKAASSTFHPVYTDVGYTNNSGLRCIMFKLDWIINIAIELAKYSDQLQAKTQLNLAPLPKWWIEG